MRTFWREGSRFLKGTAIALLVLIGGGIGGIVATSGHAPSHPTVKLVQRAATTAPTTTTTAPAPAPATTAPSVPAATTAGAPATPATPAPVGTIAPATTVPPTTRRAPTFTSESGHGCLPGLTVGISGLVGTPAPTGTITISGGGMNGTLPAAGGSWLACGTTPGTYTETVTYAGDVNWLPGSWTMPLNVG